MCTCALLLFFHARCRCRMCKMPLSYHPHPEINEWFASFGVGLCEVCQPGQTNLWCQSNVFVSFLVAVERPFYAFASTYSILSFIQHARQTAGNQQGRGSGTKTFLEGNRESGKKKRWDEKEWRSIEMGRTKAIYHVAEKCLVCKAGRNVKTGN